MKLLRLVAKSYRSLRSESIELSDLNLFIGVNASGKSTVLDALRFLHEGVEGGDFRDPVRSRGGILHLAWKGEEAQSIELEVHLEDQDQERYEWFVRIVRDGYDFFVEEYVHRPRPGSPPEALLDARQGKGTWWSGAKEQRVELKQGPTTCALAAASADASFPARNVAEFVEGWGFFDPNPFLLRRDWGGLDSGQFDPYGRNLGETLYALWTSSRQTFDRIVRATETVVGMPQKIEPRESEGRFYFVQSEPGLSFDVHQIGASSGTLRMLALMTALLGESGTTLMGIEEPENYIHPTALSSFVLYLMDERDRVQFMVTTHSPLLLDFLNEPDAVRIVQHSGEAGTTIEREENPDGVRQALEATGFGLGEYYETKGFGG